MLNRAVLPPYPRLRHTILRAVTRVSIASLLIASVCALLVGPSVMRGYPSSKEGVARIAVRKFVYEALPQWQTIHGIHCPNDLTELTPFMNSDDVKDPWGNPYIFICNVDGPNAGVVVLSTGPDGKRGLTDDTDDDILAFTASRR